MKQRSRAKRALDGLAIGDALGRVLFIEPDCLTRTTFDENSLRFTDDTRMALAICRVLSAHGEVEQDELARDFASDFAEEPDRGYGAVAHFILHQIAEGSPWREASTMVYGGTGSKGNGAAMRAPVIGAWFADDMDAVVTQAIRASEPTHAHPEGQAGAVAIAVAAAFAATDRLEPTIDCLEQILARIPRSVVRTRIESVADLLESTVEDAASQLGTGVAILAEDTVPFVIWCVLRTSHDFEEALHTTFSPLIPDSDADTLGAMVGGIVSLSACSTIPERWRSATEPHDWE